jgi:hypothetical protein
MAGTLIKQEVFGSSELKALAKAMGWSEREALGCLALLWNGSQNRKMSLAPPDLIAEWCLVDGEEQRDKLIDALASRRCGFIKRRRLLAFEIVGNRKQVSKLKELASLRARGGKTTREKFKPTKTHENPATNAEVNTGLAAGVDSSPHSPPFPSLPFPSMSLPSLPSMPGTEKGGAGPERLTSGGKSELTTQVEQSIANLHRQGLLIGKVFESYAAQYGRDRVVAVIESATRTGA